jgi:iron-sulfur cluster repair protein YtfE (RIC family)
MAAIMRGRNVTAFAAGALAGIVASRALPPLLAQAGGLARGAAGRDPFEVLTRDHRLIADLLDGLEQSPPHAVFERTQKLFRLKRRLAAHAMAEEDVLYPMLIEQVSVDARHLYSEHADMKIHLYTLENTPKDDPEWMHHLRALKSLIEGHVLQEEEEAFPKLQASMSENMQTMLLGKLQREKAMLL